ncbi:MAG: hypothetical protein HC888_09165, partial [Candidatus Competibacteraceae bacterium]|nr:hypothetical protein [Candidatus Competibacteraceae bacterium]
MANVAVGYDTSMCPRQRARGIAITNTPGVLTETTADLAWALLLAAARRTGEAPWRAVAMAGAATACFSNGDGRTPGPWTLALEGA